MQSAVFHRCILHYRIVRIERQGPLIIHVVVIGIIHLCRKRIVLVHHQIRVRTSESRHSIMDRNTLGDSPFLFLIYLERDGIRTGITIGVGRRFERHGRTVTKRPLPFFTGRGVVGEIHRLTRTRLGRGIGKIHVVLLTRNQRAANGQ